MQIPSLRNHLLPMGLVFSRVKRCGYPPLATLMVAVGLVISFATLTGWWWLMRGRVIKPPGSIFEKRPMPHHPYRREESDSNRAVELVANTAVPLFF